MGVKITMIKKEYDVYETLTFKDAWLALPPKLRPKFEKILEQENPTAFQKFKKETLSKLTDKDYLSLY